MSTPSGLSTAGKRLWGEIVGGLPPAWEFDQREQAILRAACMQADDLDALEKAIKRHGVTSTGSRKQLIVNPAVTEARLARAQLARLLGEVAIPDAEEQVQTAASKRGKHAADTRWASERRKQGAGVG